MSRILTSLLLALCTVHCALCIETVNLGDTPWSFTRVITEASSLGSGLDVLHGTHRVSEVNDNKLETQHTGTDTLMLDLLKVSRASCAPGGCND